MSGTLLEHVLFLSHVHAQMQPTVIQSGEIVCSMCEGAELSKKYETDCIVKVHNSCTSEKPHFKNFSNELPNFNLWLS